MSVEFAYLSVADTTPKPCEKYKARQHVCLTFFAVTFHLIKQYSRIYCVLLAPTICQVTRYSSFSTSFRSYLQHLCGCTTHNKLSQLTDTRCVTTYIGYCRPRASDTFSTFCGGANPKGKKNQNLRMKHTFDTTYVDSFIFPDKKETINHEEVWMIETVGGMVLKKVFARSRGREDWMMCQILCTRHSYLFSLQQ